VQSATRRLKGLGNVPRLANVHPIYLVRQLYNFQTGANSGNDAALMKRVVAKLTDEDIVNLAATQHRSGDNRGNSGQV